LTYPVAWTPVADRLHTEEVSILTPGLRLHDRFVLTERIGTGGMSQVWRATDEVLGRPVAVKMLATALAAEPGSQEATWREARAAGRLTHPNVTRIYDYGEAPLPGGGRAPYLVMELVQGRSLADRLAAGPLPWPEVARVGAQIAGALAAAHQIGVVHHDIKPGNVMLTADGAKVLDFGIAALVGAGDQPGVLAGTPTYTAPERLRPGPARPASDVYSLGVLLFELLTGQPPARFSGWEAAAAAHSSGELGQAVSLPTVPGELGELVRSCLSPDPAARPAARRVAAALAGLAGAPDPTATLPAEPPTVVTQLRYASGSAAVVTPQPPLPPPPPPTRVDDRAAAGPPGRQARSGRAPRRGWRGRALAGLALAAVVAGLLAVVVAAALPGTDLANIAGGGPDASPAATSPPAPPADASPAPRNPIAAISATIEAMGDALDSLFGERLLDRDSVEDLQGKLDDVIKEFEQRRADPDDWSEKVRDKAEDLREEIDELEEDGELDAATAAELRSLLEPLLRASG
jgi:eukaryotic-like serine/threonine-protein kinase